MRLGAEEPLCVCVRAHVHTHACPKPHPVPHEDGLEGVLIGAGSAGHRDELGHPFGSHLWGGKQSWAPLSLLPPAGPPHAGREPGMESWTQSDWEGEREAQKGLDAGGQRGEKVNKAHRSLVMALPATACTFYRWEVRIPKDTDRCGH